MQRTARGLAGAAMAMGAGIALAWAAQFPTDLGVEEPVGVQAVQTAVASGFPQLYAARTTLKAASSAQRAKMVQEALTWARAYTESSEFAAAWATMRVDSKPPPLEAFPSIDAQIEQQRKEQREQIEAMRKNSAGLPADQRQAIEEAIKQVTEATAKQQNDPTIVKIQRDALAAQQEQEKQQYEESVKQWEQSRPADPKVIIARRLQAFLDTCADVDFDAKLVPKGNLMRFAEESYERKPAQWKLCYRAGKEPVETARAFAKSWLATLPAAKP
jgi:hypothetical protein